MFTKACITPGYSCIFLLKQFWGFSKQNNENDNKRTIYESFQFNLLKTVAAVSQISNWHNKKKQKTTYILYKTIKAQEHSNHNFEISDKNNLKIFFRKHNCPSSHVEFLNNKTLCKILRPTQVTFLPGKFDSS